MSGPTAGDILGASKKRIFFRNGVSGAVPRINSGNPAKPTIWTRQGTINLINEPDIHIVAAVVA